VFSGAGVLNASFLAGVDFELRVSYLVGKHSITLAMPPALFVLAYFQIGSPAFAGDQPRTRILLSPILPCSWDYRCAPPHPALKCIFNMIIFSTNDGCPDIVPSSVEEHLFAELLRS
jgi:hypothetical protein